MFYLDFELEDDEDKLEVSPIPCGSHILSLATKVENILKAFQNEMLRRTSVLKKVE
jgi:hypothetical protein